jgi:hypothetical protein
MLRSVQITLTLKVQVSDDITPEDIDKVKAVLAAHAQEEAKMKLLAKKADVNVHSRAWYE